MMNQMQQPQQMGMGGNQQMSEEELDIASKTDSCKLTLCLRLLLGHNQVGVVLPLVEVLDSLPASLLRRRSNGLRFLLLSLSLLSLLLRQLPALSLGGPNALSEASKRQGGRYCNAPQLGIDPILTVVVIGVIIGISSAASD
jgi:hypothetical protein